MSDERFEKLKKIAREEFGCEISRSEEKSSFKEVFGIDGETARQIGINACIDRLGRDFVAEHKDKATSTWGAGYGDMFCFVGVDADRREESDVSLILDSTSRFPYRASCVVSLKDGTVTWREVVVPEEK